MLLSEAQLRVRGKGNKLRFLPLAPETVQLLDLYLRLERPSLHRRALRLAQRTRPRNTHDSGGITILVPLPSPATGIRLANPHRFRHTFASDMVRAGISLPALMQLMGHADIQTTLRYVQVTPQDVYREYTRAVAQLVRPLPRLST